MLKSAAFTTCLTYSTCTCIFNVLSVNKATPFYRLTVKFDVLQ